jgi:hypothetical protein
MPMDQELADRLNNLNKQNELLTKARGLYLLNEASRKTFEANLIKNAEGKSHAEKTINAQSTEEWNSFHLTLADLENKYEFEKLRYDILDKAFQAQYLSAKLDADTIKRG